MSVFITYAIISPRPKGSPTVWKPSAVRGYKPLLSSIDGTQVTILFRALPTHGSRACILVGAHAKPHMPVGSLRGPMASHAVCAMPPFSITILFR